MQLTADILELVKAAIPAIMGSAVSAMSVPRSVAGFSGLLSASIIGFVGGNALVEYLVIVDTSWVAFFLKFATGVFGLAILRELIKALPATVSAALNKIVGG